MKNVRFIAFSLISIAYLIAQIADQHTLIFILKPLLMPMLAWWLANETRDVPPRFLLRMVLAGLIFSTLGDVLLLFAGGESGALFFLMGLVAFLFTHLSYIGGFSSLGNHKNGFLRSQPWWVLPFLVFLTGFLWWLWPGIPTDMRLPVSVYAGVITTMALSVVNLRDAVTPKIFWPMLAGALLFMLSDCLIAVHKFGNALGEAGLAIMVTYLVGQFLIARGVRDILIIRITG